MCKEGLEENGLHLFKGSDVYDRNRMLGTDRFLFLEILDRKKVSLRSGCGFLESVHTKFTHSHNLIWAGTFHRHLYLQSIQSDGRQGASLRLGSMPNHSLTIYARLLFFFLLDLTYLGRHDLPGKCTQVHAASLSSGYSPTTPFLLIFIHRSVCHCFGANTLTQWASWLDGPTSERSGHEDLGVLRIVEHGRSWHVENVVAIIAEFISRSGHLWKTTVYLSVEVLFGKLVSRSQCDGVLDCCPRLAGIESVTKYIGAVHNLSRLASLSIG